PPGAPVLGPGTLGPAAGRGGGRRVRAVADLAGHGLLGLVGLGGGRLGHPVLADADGLVDLAGQALDPWVLPQLAGRVHDLLIALLAGLGSEHIPGTQPDQEPRLEPHWHLPRMIASPACLPAVAVRNHVLLPCLSAVRRWAALRGAASRPGQDEAGAGDGAAAGAGPLPPLPRWAGRLWWAVVAVAVGLLVRLPGPDALDPDENASVL